jgi:hypothetical protein
VSLVEVPQKNNKNKPKNKPIMKNTTAVSIETLIHEAEAELNKINTEIGEDLTKSDLSRMNELHEKKSRLAERIDTLYNEWLEWGM